QKFVGAKSASIVGAAAGGGLSGAAPPYSLSLGDQRGRSSPFTGRWCETIIFSRVLHEYERQIVREYIAARYGIAAPSLTGPDRELMSLRPFSWLDAASYDASGGKVTAFFDRALPGHSFVQQTQAYQSPSPTANPAVNGQLTATFDGAGTRYQSSLPAGAWSYLHRNPHTTYLLWVPSSLVGDQAGWSTYGTSAAAAYLYASLASAGAHQASTQGNTGETVDSSGAFGTSTVGAAKCVRVSRTSADFLVHEDGIQRYSKELGPPGSNKASTSLMIGSLQAAGSNFLNGALATMLSFDRALTSAELARVSAAISSKWGHSP
ncbi:MAG TPA: hypothetical protein VI299_18140, partial [Polyangiales bacterium]